MQTKGPRSVRVHPCRPSFMDKLRGLVKVSGDATRGAQRYSGGASVAPRRPVPEKGRPVTATPKLPRLTLRCHDGRPSHFINAVTAIALCCSRPRVNKSRHKFLKWDRRFTLQAFKFKFKFKLKLPETAHSPLRTPPLLRRLSSALGTRLRIRRCSDDLDEVDDDVLSSGVIVPPLLPLCPAAPSSCPRRRRPAEAAPLQQQRLQALSRGGL